MIDTHTHIYMPDTFPDGGEEAVEKSLEAGVRHLVLPNIDVESVRPLLSLHDKYPEVTSVARGLHPTEVKASWRDDLREIRDRFADTPVVAVGEIGLDFYWTKENVTRQMDAFGEQLDLAYSEGLPVIIHSRDALDATLEITRSMGERLPRLLFHSFTYGPEEASRIIETHPDSMFGFNGVITFRNASEVREAATLVGLGRIVLETDSPYLAPVPFRGRTNTSAYIPYIMESLAATVGATPEEVERITDENASSLFSIPVT